MKTTIQRYASVLAAASALLAGGRALAQDPVEVTQSYCIPDGSPKDGGFETSNDVLNGGNLVLNGNATIIDAPGMPFDGALQLTKAANGQVSEVYYKDPLDFDYVDVPAKTTRPFRTFFSFSIGPNPTGSAMGQGAGLAFIGQNFTNQAYQTGANGQGIGYGGILKSWAVEVDTFKDGSGSNLPDPAGDHLGLVVDGNPSNHQALYSPKDMGGNPIVFGNVTYKRYYIWIDYPGNGSKMMSVYLSDQKVKPDTPIAWMEQPLPLGVMEENFPRPSSFDTTYWMSRGSAQAQAWVGFTAANYVTGKNAHNIHEWEFSNVGIPCACQGAAACKAAPGTVACSAGPNTQGTGVCVECTTADTTGCTPDKPVCHPTDEVCVECNVDSDCTSDLPVCDPASHTCGPCTSDADCNGSPQTPACAMSGMNAGTCVECVKDANCPQDKPACDVTKNVCVECVKDADCPEDTPKCNSSTHVCGTGCTTDADCMGTPETPVCAVSGVNQGTCVECTKDANCPEDKPVCDEPTNTCTTECTTDKDCPPDMPICDPQTHTCTTGCTTDQDCPAAKPVCDTVNGVCGPCSNDSQCTRFEDTPVCVASGDTKGQCGPKPGDGGGGVIEGGGCACRADRSSSNEGLPATALVTLTVATALARRRRKGSKR